jgi:hypothetical protein
MVPYRPIRDNLFSKDLVKKKVISPQSRYIPTPPKKVSKKYNGN